MISFPTACVRRNSLHSNDHGCVNSVRVASSLGDDMILYYMG